MEKKVNVANWFEIPVRDMSRAVAFYEHVCGVKLRPNEMGPLKMAWFPWEAGAEGAPGSLVCGPGYVPSDRGSIVYLTVDDLDAALGRVEATGGKVLQPRTPIGEYGFVAHFGDCEGNRVALHSMQ
ncbi:MAG: VOC family protein [Deltaproteobacteria bacterium]|nr:VOC family protein [Deltaproteobacteria bacterium]